jgi:hypothetical protein
VRTLVNCDRIRPSPVEEQVFHLRGARYRIVADRFPLRRRLWLFVILSSPRPGLYPCYVRIAHERTDRTVFYGDIGPAPMFEEGAEELSLEAAIKVRFPEAGRYMVQFWFFQETGPDVLKMEQPLDLLEERSGP